MRAALFFLAKLIITAVLFWWLFELVSLKELGLQISSVGALGFIVAVVVLIMHVPAIIARWGMVQHAIGAPLRGATLFRLTMVSLFFNQMLPAPVSGDAARIIGLKAEGLELSTASAGVLLDRLWGLAALLLIAVPFWPWMVPWVDDPVGYATATATFGMVLAFWFLLRLRRPPAWLVRAAPEGLRPFLDAASATASSWARVFGLLAWSFAGHISAVAAMAALACAMGLQISPFQIFVATNVALLAPIIPASFAGWGVREAGLVLTLSSFGVDEASALALSVCFGMTLVPIALPGGVIWMFRARSA